jgi:hypothetical protein
MVFFITIMIMLYFFWNYTQKYLSFERPATQGIIDKMHDSKFICRLNIYLSDHPIFAKLNIILTTLLLDINIVYVILTSIINDDSKPIFLIVFGVILRQLCQFINKLPTPQNMIWFDPHFPTFFMVYNTVNDFFFSGHTLISIITGVTIYSQTANVFVALYAILFIIYEISFVAISKSHYFMDIYAGVSTYFMLSYFFDKCFGF